MKKYIGCTFTNNFDWPLNDQDIFGVWKIVTFYCGSEDLGSHPGFDYEAFDYERDKIINWVTSPKIAEPHKHCLRMGNKFRQDYFCLGLQSCVG